MAAEDHDRHGEVRTEYSELVLETTSASTQRIMRSQLSIVIIFVQLNLRLQLQPGQRRTGDREEFATARKETSAALPQGGKEKPVRLVEP